MIKAVNANGMQQGCDVDVVSAANEVPSLVTGNRPISDLCRRLRMKMACAK